MGNLDQARMREFNETIGELLRDLRDARKLSRKTVVGAFPVLTVEQLRQIELGRCSLPANVFFWLIKYYGVNLGCVDCILFDATVRLKSSLANCPPEIKALKVPPKKPTPSCSVIFLSDRDKRFVHTDTNQDQ